MNRAKRIDIVYMNAGGGHVSTMNALRAECERRYPHWHIRPVNLREVLQPIDIIQSSTRKLKHFRENLEDISPRIKIALQKETFAPLALKLAAHERHSEDVYNDMLKAGKTDGLKFLLMVLQGYIRLRSGSMEKLLRQHWSEPDGAPDMVVSVIPNFNRVLFRALKKSCPDVPYLTIMTDLVDIGRHFWIEKQPQILVCGTAEAQQQAEHKGFVAGDNLFQLSGMILRSAFYQPRATRPLPMVELTTDRTTALIMFGGYGSTEAEKIVDRLNASALPVQCIVMCGKNTELLERLRGKPHCHAVGFTDRVVDYMDRADFMIGKPGPGSLEEARCRGLPVMVLNDKTTMPQERPNVTWVEHHGIGFGVASFDTIVADVGRMLSNLSTYRRHIAQLPPNNALNEAVDIIVRCLQGASHSTAKASSTSTSWRTTEPSRKRV